MWWLSCFVFVSALFPTFSFANPGSTTLPISGDNGHSLYCIYGAAAWLPLAAFLIWTTNTSYSLYFQYKSRMCSQVTEEKLESWFEILV